MSKKYTLYYGSINNEGVNEEIFVDKHIAFTSPSSCKDKTEITTRKAMVTLIETVKAERNPGPEFMRYSEKKTLRGINHKSEISEIKVQATRVLEDPNLKLIRVNVGNGRLVVFTGHKQFGIFDESLYKVGAEDAEDKRITNTILQSAFYFSPIFTNISSLMKDRIPMEVELSPEYERLIKIYKMLMTGKPERRLGFLNDVSDLIEIKQLL